MSEKVVIPKEVAEAIESLRNYDYTDFGIVKLSVMPIGNESAKVISDWTHDNPGDNPQALLSALVNGYTVEQTPEEAVREYYDNTVEIEKAAGTDGDYYSGQIYAIEYVLTLLGIKIEGVNA